MPFDSIPIFSKYAVYFPIVSIFFCFIYIVIENKIKYTNKQKILSYMILFFLLAISLMKGIFIYKDFKGFKVFFVQIISGIIFFAGTNIFLRKVRNKNTLEKYVEKITKLLIGVNIPMLIFGIAEIIGLLIPRMSILVDKVNTFFSYRIYENRIQMFSGEPSWAARILVFLISFSLIKEKVNKVVLGLLVLLLLFTGSTLGIGTLLLAFIIAFIVNGFKKNTLLYIVMFIIFSAIVFLYIFKFGTPYMKNRIVDLINLKNLSDTKSGSIMARLGFPYLGIRVGIDNPLLGVGGGYYYKYHYEYLFKIFKESVNIKNIYLVGESTKNLYSRIISEMGFIVFFIILKQGRDLYKRMNRNVVKNKFYFKFLFVIMVLLNINFDSYMYLYPIFIFCFLKNLDKRGSSNEKNLFV